MTHGLNDDEITRIRKHALQICLRAAWLFVAVGDDETMAWQAIEDAAALLADVGMVGRN
jgi:hypothetical protein